MGRNSLGDAGDALFGYGRNDDKIQSTDAGFDAHVTKPVDFDVLERASWLR